MRGIERTPPTHRGGPAETHPKPSIALGRPVQVGEEERDLLEGAVLVPAQADGWFAMHRISRSPGSWQLCSASPLTSLSFRYVLCSPTGYPIAAWQRRMFPFHRGCCFSPAYSLHFPPQSSAFPDSAVFPLTPGGAPVHLACHVVSLWPCSPAPPYEGQAVACPHLPQPLVRQHSTASSLWKPGG